MPTTAKPSPIKAFDYRAASQAILRHLKRDRDRQVIARRFGFDLAKRQTLEQIGQNFGITRERVRQIEKATLTKIVHLAEAEVEQANRILSAYLKEQGGVARLSNLAAGLGATGPQQQAYILFLASLAPDIAVIEEDDQVRAGVGLLPVYSPKTIRELIAGSLVAVKKIGKPATAAEITKAFDGEIAENTLSGVMAVSKQLAHFDTKWGLTSWPQVNPRSIRDKTYLVLGKHGKPMHFTEISDHIRNSQFRRRDVTVQAVHNELIKDSRFVLIGRGIYALSEWGYTPGTVADIIIEVLREESPLHKDEIVKRVLKKRQVRTTTIILNLQEKGHFERVAKATYKLKDK